MGQGWTPAGSLGTPMGLLWLLMQYTRRWGIAHACQTPLCG